MMTARTLVTLVLYVQVLLLPGAAVIPIRNSAASLRKADASWSAAVPCIGGGGERNGSMDSQKPQQQQAKSMKKQGAYGKIQIHKEPIWKQLIHFDEVVAMLVYSVVWKRWHCSKNLLDNPWIQQHFFANGTTTTKTTLDQDLQFCQDMLGHVSRSFATVIQQLPITLQVDVLIFYLVLRALDTIEDDTVAYRNDMKTKINLLKNFYQVALTELEEEEWKLEGVGAGYEQQLLQEFPKVQHLYSKLSESTKTIIQDITKRMGAGMAEFVAKDLSQGTFDVDQYNRYCYYVAGLVGEGLSRLFAASGLEQDYLADEVYLSNQMGMFLQKTNIIRDYLEDYVEGRAFWPQSIYNKYSETGELGYFAANNSHSNEDDASNTKNTTTNTPDVLVQVNSIKCLNEMIADALELAPSCLAYLSELHCAPIFRFCALPQIMALATLDKCFAYPHQVFSGVVKIRKGLSCKLLVFQCHSLDHIHESFYVLAKSIERKAKQLKQHDFADPSLDQILDSCDVICAMTESAYHRNRRAKMMPIVFVLSVLACQFIPQLNLGLIIVAMLNFYFGPSTIKGKTLLLA
jgi:farnesyl-diphosphate farnesyltransferase